MRILSKDNQVIDVDDQKIATIGGYIELINHDKPCDLDYILLEYIFDHANVDIFDIIPIDKVAEYILSLLSLNLTKKGKLLLIHALNHATVNDLDILIKLSSQTKFSLNSSDIRNMNHIGYHVITATKIDMLNNDDKKYILFKSVKNGHLGIVKLLHENGIDIRIDKNAAMILAAQYGHLEIVQYLHKVGSGLNVNNYGDYAIRAAIYQGHLEILQFFHQIDTNMDTRSVFLMACSKGHINIVKYFFE